MRNDYRFALFHDIGFAHTDEDFPNAPGHGPGSGGIPQNEPELGDLGLNPGAIVPAPPEGVTQIAGDPYSGIGPHPLDENKIVNWTYYPFPSTFGPAGWQAGNVAQPGAPSASPSAPVGLTLEELQSRPNHPSGTVSAVAQVGPSTYMEWRPLQGVAIRYDLNPNTGLYEATFTDSTPPPIPADAIRPAGGVRGPVNALANLDQEIFDPAALNAVRGQAGLDPLDQAVTQGSTLSQFLVNPGRTTEFTGTSPSGQASALDFASTLQGSPGFDPMNAGAQEVAALLALQNQQENIRNTLSQSLGLSGVNSLVGNTNDPIANAALQDQFWQMQQANIASGLTPAEAAFMTSRQLGVQPRAGLVDPLRQGGTLNP